MNLSKVKVPVKVAAPEFRVRNFQEITATISSLTDAQEEARRCLRCPKRPCVTGCPAHNQIPEFIEQVALGNVSDAYEILTQTTSLPAVCSRVCPQEVQCEGACTRGKNGEPVNIGGLERFVADFALTKALDMQYNTSPNSGSKVAVIGSGPAGIGAADVLTAAGCQVDVFEARSYFGGVLEYGIPTFRLPKPLVGAKLNSLVAAGVNVKLNTQVGVDISLNELVDEYDAVFIGNGAQIPKRAQIPGENAQGVLQALDFLDQVSTSLRTDDKGEESVANLFGNQAVVVIGGGNVAMDVAATAVRCGAKSVTVTYRRSMAELPAREEEVRLNEEEGVIFKLLTSPREILTDAKSGRVRALVVQDVELGEPDESGRRSPICKVGTESEMPADIVILALGSDADPSVTLADGIELNTDMRGQIQVDADYKTSHPKIWAGGDNVTGPLTVVSAMVAGRMAAQSILNQFQ
jgi:glutamate synthase (NADPH/NADH) small chain